MRIIVDGYNLIRRSSLLSSLERQDLEAGREGLLRMLAEYQRLKGHRVTVVFDGWEGGLPVEQHLTVRGISVIFSKKGEQADEVIKHLASPGLVIITSDRGLSEAVERSGAAAIGAEEFLERVQRASYAQMKGVEEETTERSQAKRKGPARRPPRALRRKEEVLRKL